jgi:hypothetical protein
MLTVILLSAKYKDIEGPSVKKFMLERLLDVPALISTKVRASAAATKIPTRPTTDPTL